MVEVTFARPTLLYVASRFKDMQQASFGSTDQAAATTLRKIAQLPPVVNLPLTLGDVIRGFTVLSWHRAEDSPTLIRRRIICHALAVTAQLLVVESGNPEMMRGYDHRLATVLRVAARHLHKVGDPADANTVTILVDGHTELAGVSPL